MPGPSPGMRSATELYRPRAAGARTERRLRRRLPGAWDDTRIADDRQSSEVPGLDFVAGRWSPALGLVVVAFVTASSLLFVWPATDQPQHVDAILSLNGGNEPARESLAISLAEQGYARVLLFSQGNSHTTPCPEVPTISVVCFAAEPGRTAGEVKFAARYARRHGWHSLMIVPGRAQVTRARLLMNRCFSGHVAVVAAPVKLGADPLRRGLRVGCARQGPVHLPNVLSGPGLDRRGRRRPLRS